MNRLKIKRSLFEKASPDAPLLLSIISGKGGVGKSVVGFNLAHQIAMSNSRVLMVDADANFGNQHIMANLSVEHGLNEVVKQTLSLKEAVVKVSDNFDLLASPHRVNPFEEDQIADLAGFVNQLRQQKNYEVVILDHASGMSKQSATLAYASDVCLIVIVPELSSISDGYGLFKYLKSSSAEIDCRLMINRTENEAEAEYIFSKFCALSERFLGTVPEFAGYVTEDDAMRRSLAAQQPLAVVAAESVALANINLLASNILNKPVGTHSADPETPESRINKTTAYADIKE